MSGAHHELDQSGKFFRGRTDGKKGGQGTILRQDIENLLGALLYAARMTL